MSGSGQRRGLATRGNPIVLAMAQGEVHVAWYLLRVLHEAHVPVGVYDRYIGGWLALQQGHLGLAEQLLSMPQGRADASSWRVGSSHLHVDTNANARDEATCTTSPHMGVHNGSAHVSPAVSQCNSLRSSTSISTSQPRPNEYETIQHDTGARDIEPFVIRVDGSFFQNKASGGVGIAAPGHFMLSIPSPIAVSPGVMEMVAVLLAAILAVERGHRDIVILSDCKEAVGQLMLPWSGSFGPMPKEKHRVIRNFVAAAMGLLRQHVSVDLQWRPRTMQGQAHNLAHSANSE